MCHKPTSQLGALWLGEWLSLGLPPGQLLSLCASLGWGGGDEEETRGCWALGGAGVPPCRTIASGVLGGPLWEKATPPRPTLG